MILLNSMRLAQYQAPEELIKLLEHVDRRRLSGEVIHHKYDYMCFLYKGKNSTEGEDRGYVESRSEINTRVLPKVAQTKSYKVLLQEGKTYYWCTCGLSQA